MLVFASAVVVHVRGGQQPRERFDGVDRVSHDVGVPEVEAHADIGEVEIVFDHPDERVRRRQRVRDDLEGDADAQRGGERHDLREAAHGCLARVGRGIRMVARQPDMDDEDVRGEPASQLQRRGDLGQGERPLLLHGRGGAEGPAPAAVFEPVGDGRVDGVQPQTARGHPAGQVVQRPRVVVVDVGPGGDDLECAEAVRRDLVQVVRLQPLAVIELGRHTEQHGHAPREGSETPIVAEACSRTRVPPLTTQRSSGTAVARIACSRPNRSYFRRLARA